jgi:hypothetical protein
VDRVLQDRDEVNLGGVTLVARWTPGCTTWTWKVEDGGKTYDVVVIGSPNVNPGYQLVNNKDYAGLPATVFAAKETTHSRINADLGKPDDAATRVLFEFLGKALKE